MKLTLEDIGKLKNQYNNDNELNICLGVDEVKEDLKLNEKEKKIVSIITNPDQLCKFILQEGLIIEKYIYTKDNEKVFIENNNNTLELTIDDSKDKILNEYATFIGISPLKLFNINLDLSNDEFITFISIIDIIREKELTNLMNNSDYAINFKDIRKQLETPSEKSLTFLFKMQYLFNIPTIKDTKPLLDELIKKDILSFDKNYQLKEEYQLFATNFLTINQTLTIDLLKKDKDVTESYLLYISSGTKNNILIDFGNDGINIMTISENGILKVIENAINY